jgi:hypothetical protein
MKISGPVAYYKYEFKGRHVKLFADLHNSTEGECLSLEHQPCLEFDPKGNKIGTNDKCLSLTRFLDKALNEQGLINFYFESAFVLRDSLPINVTTQGLDYIDQITVLFAKSLMRDKSLSPYKAHVHYVDIRSAYNSDFQPGSQKRQVISCNPFSGSWLVAMLRNGYLMKNAIEDLRFIIDNAWKIFDSVTGERYFEFEETDFIPPRGWIERMGNVSRITSTFNGKRIHRVGKQLMKLSPGDRKNLLEWAREKFEKERQKSIQSLKRLSEENVNSNDWRNDDDLADRCVMVLIPMSSVLMDVYLLGRLIYQKSDKDIIFAGLAHIDNYRDFFDRYGAKLLVSRLPTSDRLKRCIEF